MSTEDTRGRESTSDHFTSIPTFLDREFSVPEEFGTVLSVHRGKGDTGVILVQDAHAVYSAQKNWAGILIHLIERYGWNLVCVEGGTRDDRLTEMRQLASPERRLRVAEEFLQAGRISGENYVDLACDYPLIVWGVDSSELYRANKQALFDVTAQSAEPLAGLKAAEQRLEQALIEACGPEFAGLTVIRTKATSGAIPLVDFYKELFTRAVFRGLSVDGRSHPALLNFLHLAEMESSLNIVEAHLQQSHCLISGCPDVSLEVLDSLRERFRECSKERSPRRGWLHFADAFDRHEPLRKLFPHAWRYADYVRASSHIDRVRLFAEAKDVERMIRRHIARSTLLPELIEIDQCLEAVVVLQKMYAVQATPEDYENYLLFKADGRYSPDSSQGIRAYVRHTAHSATTDGSALANLDLAMERRQVAAEFYRIAKDRSNTMFENMLARRRDFKTNVAVFVAGGFHTEAIRQRLRDEVDESFAIVAPHVKLSPGDREKYHQIMRTE